MKIKFKPKTKKINKLILKEDSCDYNLSLYLYICFLLLIEQ